MVAVAGCFRFDGRRKKREEGRKKLVTCNSIGCPNRGKSACGSANVCERCDYSESKDDEKSLFSGVITINIWPAGGANPSPNGQPRELRGRRMKREEWEKSGARATETDRW